MNNQNQFKNGIKHTLLGLFKQVLLAKQAQEGGAVEAKVPEVAEVPAAEAEVAEGYVKTEEGGAKPSNVKVSLYRKYYDGIVIEGIINGKEYDMEFNIKERNI
jgi:hypothetical protein